MASPLLKRFLISLNRNWLYGLLSFAAVLGGAVGIAYLPDPEPPPPEYKAVGRFALRIFLRLLPVREL